MSAKPPVKEFYGRSAKELAFGADSFIGNVPLAFHSDHTNPIPLTNVPAAFTRVFVDVARWFDATAFDAVRCVIHTTTATLDGAEFVAIYSATPWDAASWKIAGLTDDQIGALADDPVVPMNLTGPQAGGFRDLATAARADVCWGIAVRGGDGVTDGAFGYVGLEFGRTGVPVALLVPWYLRHLASSANLSSMAEGAQAIGSVTVMNPNGENPRTAASGAGTLLHHSGSSSAITPLTTIYQLKRAIATSATSARLIAAPSGATPPNFASTVGRFSTPALRTQNIRRFVALLHRRTVRGHPSLGNAWTSAWIFQFRPGVGIVRQYTATTTAVAATSADAGPSAGSPLPIDVRDNLAIVLGDRIVVEVHLTSQEDTLGFITEFPFDGTDTNPPDGPSPPYNFAAWIEMPDFDLVPGSL